MWFRRVLGAVVAAGLGAPAAVMFPARASAGPLPLVPAAGLASRPAPAGAVDIGPAPRTTLVHLELVLAPSDRAGLDALLAAQSDRRSADYHRWLAPADFDHRYGPAAATVAGVTDWLRSRGLHPSRSSAFEISVEAPAGQLPTALGTTFERYRTRSGASGLVAHGDPLVPAGLSGQIVAIAGLDTLPAFQPESVLRPPGRRSTTTSVAVPLSTTSGAPVACSSAVSASGNGSYYTLDQLGAAYGVNHLWSAGLTGRNQSVGLYELAPHSGTDVATYESCFGLSNPVSTVSVDGGGSPDTNGTAEADLDIEQVATQAPAASVVSYEGPNTDVGALDTWTRIVNDDTVKVVSTSWTVCEPDAQPAGELSQFGPLFLQAAAQGQTVVAAAGDSGSEGCYQSDGTTQLATEYPASDPNVTAVGGTDLVGPGNEPVWNDCGNLSCAYADYGQAAGGGGLSAYEPRPSYQSAITTPPSNCGGSACRALPDISANSGVPMVVYVNGYWGAGVGTSFAAPFLAGMVADRNGGCRAATGALNPILYGLAGQAGSYGTALSDVTSGSNDMTGSHAGLYQAGAGYDLASGLGSPLAGGLTCPEVMHLSETQGAAGDTLTITGLGLEGAAVSFGSAAATVTASNAGSVTVTVPSGSGTVTVSASGILGTGTMTAQFSYGSTTTTTTTPPCPTATGPRLPSASGISAVSISGCSGYLVTDGAGQISAFGAARSYGDMYGVRLAAPVIAVTATADGQGYWLLGADGGIFSFGDAHFYGSTGNMRLNAPVVGMAVTPDSKGYWLVAEDGGVFSFGDARFYGSTGNMRLAQPVDGIAVAPGGNGYWLVARDGGVFTFTTDGFYGSLGNLRLAAPIVGMSGTADGRGYTLVGSDGGVFCFGDAPFYGSLGLPGAKRTPAPIVALATVPGNDGYYLVASDGTVYNFGPAAAYFGDA